MPGASVSSVPVHRTVAPPFSVTIGSARPESRISSLPASGTVVFQTCSSGSNEVEAHATDWNVMLASGTS